MMACFKSYRSELNASSALVTASYLRGGSAVAQRSTGDRRVPSLNLTGGNTVCHLARHINAFLVLV